ncbi:MAG: tetratricopeptide repeat protein [Sandaracinaceae bacterium]
MSRSAVLTGRIDARDRAKLRGRLDRPPSRGVDPFVEIRGWLEASSYGSEERDAMVRLDLDHYLHETGHIELPAEERLRQLAIFVEPTYAAVAPDALDRIYEAAARLAPEDHFIWHSRGISAKLVATSAEKPSTVARFEKLSLRCLLRAWELDATDPGVTYSLGKWHYELGTATEDAAEWFEQTLALDPDHGYALLFRAHCLHDQERWGEAVEAYRAVPLETFEGPKAWLVEIVQEAQAYCLLRAGDRAGALREFERLLERFEREPRRAEMLALRYLTKACRGPLREELWPAYCRLSRLIGLPS